MEDVLAKAVLDRDRWVERLRLGANVVFPEGAAGLRLQGGHETAAGAALIAGNDGGDDLLERAAGDAQLAGGDDRRSQGHVERVRAGEVVALRIELPTLLSGRAVQPVEPAAQVAEKDRVIGNECRAEDASFVRRLQAYDRGVCVVRLGLGGSLWLCIGRVAIGPADLAIGRKLIERRVVGGRAEVNTSGHDDGRGMDNADLLVRLFGGKPPFLFQPAGVLSADGGLTRVVAGA